jgi:hypothetical protein
MIVCTEGELAPGTQPSDGDPLVVPVLTNILAPGAGKMEPKLANIWRPISALARIV